MDSSTQSLLRSVHYAAWILIVLAGLLAAGTLWSSYVGATTDLNEFYGGPPVDFPNRYKFSQFLQSSIPNLGWAGLLVAASFALKLTAARLTIDPAVDQAPSVDPLPPDEPPLIALPITIDEDVWRRR